MKNILLFLTLLFSACEPVYTQITYDRIISLRDNFYNAAEYSLIDSTKFTLVEVHQTYASGWSSEAKYWNQKFDLRYYPDFSTAVPLGTKIGTLKTYSDFPLDDFISYLDTNHLGDFSYYGLSFPLLQNYYDDFCNMNVTSVDTFNLYLNHENTWHDGIDGPRTLFYNSEFLSFVPIGSTYIDTINTNLKHIFIGTFFIDVLNDDTLDNWFIYFNEHKYDSL